MTCVRKMYVLLCGYEIVPRLLSLRDGGNRFYLAEPICAYLLDTDTGWVLMDTGLDESRANDAKLAQSYYYDRGWSTLPVVRPVHSLERQLETIGVKPPIFPKSCSRTCTAITRDISRRSGMRKYTFSEKSTSTRQTILRSWAGLRKITICRAWTGSC